ncbi:MAG: glycoside hydrolase family 16 protein [Gemmatimonadaceae bacterium]
MQFAMCMLRSALAFSGALAVGGCTKAPTTQGTPIDTTPAVPGEWKLSWSDEFDGASGALVDPGKWTAETGGGGWGNQERQYYTTSASNASLDGSGHLVITARAEPVTSSLTCWYGSCRYTSARIKTQGRFEQAYGKFEARIRIPRGQGLWPAFWMLGNDIDRNGWPKSGEIDIMESIGKEPYAVYGTLHGPGYSGSGSIGSSYSLAAVPFADNYHVFTVEWSPGEVRWIVDGTEYRRTSTANLPSAGTWVFDHAFFMLLNVAVGGNWPGDPDATTTFPQQMLVDYVRVYQR